MFIQNFMPGRIIGMLVSGAVLIGLIFFIGQLPFYHPLMNFGDVGAGAYSEMAGFSNTKAFGWEFAYWMGLILILGALSIWVWRRGHQIGLKGRLQNIGNAHERAIPCRCWCGFTGLFGLRLCRATELQGGRLSEF